VPLTGKRGRLNRLEVKRNRFSGITLEERRQRTCITGTTRNILSARLRGGGAYGKKKTASSSALAERERKANKPIWRAGGKGKATFVGARLWNQMGKAERGKAINRK